MKFSAVLPLCIRGSYDIDDLGRTDILFKSLSAFGAADVLDKILIVCPDNEVTTGQTLCKKWQHLNVEVVSEDVLVPEFQAHKQVRGWRKQQIIKLAAPRLLDADFYLTLDADVICLQPLTRDLLLPGKKALLQYEKRVLHPKWWTSSAQILRMSPEVGDPSVGMSVTPAIMASEISTMTGEEIAANLRGAGSWVDKLCRLHNPRSPSNWTLYRQRRGRWTEYSLYYLCAQKRNVLQQYHVTAGTPEYPQQLLIHDSHPYEEWDAAKNFATGENGLFCVVNSSTRLAPETVWQKVAPFVPYYESQPSV